MSSTPICEKKTNLPHKTKIRRERVKQKKEKKVDKCYFLKRNLTFREK